MLGASWICLKYERINEETPRFMVLMMRLGEAYGEMQNSSVRHGYKEIGMAFMCSGKARSTLPSSGKENLNVPQKRARATLGHRIFAIIIVLCDSYERNDVCSPGAKRATPPRAPQTVPHSRVAEEPNPPQTRHTWPHMGHTWPHMATRAQSIDRDRLARIQSNAMTCRVSAMNCD